MWKQRLGALLLLCVAGLFGYFVYTTELPVVTPGLTATSTPTVTASSFAFKLGLDLRSGSHLIYKADTSGVSDVSDAMNSLRDVIERRVNLFGVSEPVVQLETGGTFGNPEERLIVELPGVTNVKEAVELIGKTPLLEFKLMKEEAAKLSQEELGQKTLGEVFIPTALTGRYV